MSTKSLNYQSVYTSNLPTLLLVGASFDLPIYYEASDPALTGLSLNIHFASSILGLTLYDSKVADLFGTPTIFDDIDDLDKDERTDRILQFNWVSFAGSFPNVALPVEIARVKFKLLEFAQVGSLPQSTTIHFTGQASPGYTFSGKDTLIALDYGNSPLTPSATSINEGSTLTTSVATINILSGTTLYYSLSGSGITATDFSSGSLLGSGTVGPNGSFSFSHTLANDLTTEGTETLSIKLFSDSNRLIKIGETNVSIVDYVGGSTDYSYSLSKLSGLTSSISLIGAFENFQFYNLGGNRQGIQKKGTGAIDEITGISTLTFNDSRISVSDSIIGVFNQVTGKETKDAQMFRLYNASFNRFPDSDGLKYWINEYSKGITDYRNIAESFIISSEFKQRYGASNTNLEFATNMYKNILGRLPDAEGLNYWVSNLNAGTNSRVDVLGGFSESVENKNLFSQVTGFV